MAVRKRVKGRFVSEVGGGVEAEKRVEQKASGCMLRRPEQCRKFARRRMAEALPDIVDRFIREAKLGSIPHAKALAALGGLDKAESPIQTTRAKRRRPGLTEMLMQELKRGREADGESSSAL